MKTLSKIIIASSAGIITGYTLGLLFAPKKGKKTRKDISKKSKKIMRKINEQVNKEKFTELKNEFGGQLDKINEKIKSFANID
ncbi:MAG TPA: YtxH domain-containing protein [Hanamia sp.]|nr:YtxH domain-containing protein [Hanamia sp.]